MLKKLRVAEPKNLGPILQDQSTRKIRRHIKNHSCPLNHEALFNSIELLNIAN